MRPLPSAKLLLVPAVAAGSFWFGQSSVPPEPVTTTEIFREISIVSLAEISGDELVAEVSGPVRIVWNDTQFIESDGVHRIPLGQVPSDTDKNFRDFAFVGNTKTNKFYSSDTYWARGTDPKHRRFFATYDEAVAAGFVPTKSKHTR